ncbi:hypothetical protein CMK11_08525 [Candidatus Poribacteria bacterium]|jgi:hypothetical protein|nr:hypothetical protein [Candidatus Poribacteria bacterium]
MLYQGHRYVRLSTKLARALGMTYRAMWNQLQNDDSGFTVLRVPTRQPQKRLMYIRLADINRALGYPLYDPPTLAGHGAHANTRAEDGRDEHTQEHHGEHHEEHHEETDDAGHPKA